MYINVCSVNMPITIIAYMTILEVHTFCRFCSDFAVCEIFIPNYFCYQHIRIFNGENTSESQGKFLSCHPQNIWPSNLQDIDDKMLCASLVALYLYTYKVVKLMFKLRSINSVATKGLSVLIVFLSSIPCESSCQV